MYPSKPIILAINDDARSLTSLSGMLRAEGYDVHETDSGPAAMASAAALSPDLILLDLHGRGIDGLDACQRLKESEASRGTPLILISGASEVDLRARGLELGAVDFITKPFSREELLARVRTQLELSQLRANLEKEVGKRTSELSAALDKLREEEELVSLSVESAGAGLWALDYTTGVFWATERTRKMFDFSPDEVITSERVDARVHPDDRERVREVLAEARRERHPVDAEHRIVLSDGSVRWVASRGRPHSAPTGEVFRLMGVTIDITEREAANEALRTGKTRLETGAELAGLAYYEVDFGTDTMFLDDRIRDLCGIPSNRDKGLQPLRFWVEHLHPEDSSWVLEIRNQLLDGRLERSSLEYRYQHPTLGQRWIHHLVGVARRDATGRAVHMHGVMRDITERREAEEALRRSLAEINQLKDRLQAEGDYLKAEMRLNQNQGAIIGQSAAIQRVFRLAEQVAPTDSSVLVRGETGTGKELIAQAIHQLSPRRGNVMVKINCAALPSGLVESELFGRERGAYTGAMTRQVGRFEIADGSTLFLDEIGELPLDQQSKLLRVLESGEFERLGSARTIKVDVRIIAATNRDLPEAIKQGKFREDLYYRLNVFPLHVPPLRDRLEDIPPLVWSFLQEFSSRMGKKITQVPKSTMEALQRHSWPGNVRELRNVIEHGSILTTDDTLKIPSLDSAPTAVPPGQTLAAVEREHISRVLERAGWHIKGPKGAAAQLGINPGTLYGRMKKLGIPLRRQTEPGQA
jgi:PAS domain S-box-containing protein